MKVYLAGYNVDTDVLKNMEEKSGKRDDLTPEVLSAAYARISRDPRPINEIRGDARGEVEKSRKSNSTIIFKMGHHSVAEHAVFNLDIIGVSRFAMEELEKFRLCSYTEKSQRYITLDRDFVVPDELKGSRFADDFVLMVRQQNEAYFKLFEKLKEHVFIKYPDMAKEPGNHNLLECWAKEDARYITALAMESQVGHTINARNLELMLRRFASHSLSEIRELGRMIYDRVSEVAPSVIIFHEANDRDLKTYPELRETAREIIKNARTGDMSGGAGDVKLVEFTENGDEAIAAALLHVSTDMPYEKCREVVNGLGDTEKEEVFKASWRNMQFYDSMLREYEYAELTYNIVLSSACFGQLKRHRMTTISSQPYDPGLGVTVPESVEETGMRPYFEEIVEKTNELYGEIKKEIPAAAPYILTNSHRKRVLVRLNARELYHISRLREDAHAQWDIQNISRDMTRLAKKVMPFTFSLIGGKDRYNEIYQGVYGRLPKVQEAVLPGARKLK